MEIHLLNNGDLSKRRYGDKLELCREISQTPSYKVKTYETDEPGVFSETKRWKKIKKLDLDKMLRRLNIYPKNPLQFLTQENARSFHSAHKPKTLYAIFQCIV